MDEEVFNMSMRKFLKAVGVTSQRELEQAVRDAIASGRLEGTEEVKVKMQLTCEVMAKPFEVDGTLKLA
ncbi:MAG: hypothetical protein JSR43_10210 [Proteobacteria bacterium]|jgi:hypothetical protein|nr:hypothetical protein [Pseudomonadota bacterium]HOL36500.1 DUF6494 family protein [Rubrivivax sp.]